MWAGRIHRLLGALPFAILLFGCDRQTPSEESAVATAHLDTTKGRGLVISQVYGGGGQSDAVYNRDFVELFNRTSSPIKLAGLSIHYAATAGDFAYGGTLPDDAVVPPGGYYLVGFAAGSAGRDLRTDGAGLPYVNILPVNGKIALVRDVEVDPKNAPDAAAQQLGCGRTEARCNDPRIIDMVGYGAATDHEGNDGPAPAPGVATAIRRKGGGCVDTGSSANDFETAPPEPRTLASPRRVCEGAGNGGDR
jgi:hypothetical protein